MTTAQRFTSNPLILDEALSIIFDGTKVSAVEASRAEGLSDDQRAAALEAGKWEETFTTRTSLPGAVLDEMMGSVTMAKNGQGMKIHQAQSIPILRQVIAPADLPRFEKLIVDHDRVVDLTVLWMAATYAVETMSGRPTGGSGA